MRCQEIHAWTFCGLVGAFLDLWLAYLMLCGSVLAFFASKFLGIFGWHLPCPCNGFFGVPHGDKCLQRLLVDYPIRRISSVQLSVKSNVPFDSMWMRDQGYPSSVKLLEDTDRCDGPRETEGEASCSSISDAKRRSRNFAVRDPSPGRGPGGLELMSSAVPDGRADVWGKGVVNQRPRSGLRRRRKAVSAYRKSSSFSSSDLPRLTKRGVSYSPSSMSESGHDISVEGSMPMNSAGIAFQDASYVKEFVRDELGFDGSVKNVIRVLDQALEEEQAERAALYLELEKERSAAATAADEAMAMIMRLQKEKASIEMEARQYQRMIEEKSAYDTEEMDILKEIIVRREKEKHFLEKEVETYRQLILLNSESLGGVTNDMVEISAPRSTFSLDSSEDPEPMLRQISESIDKREIDKNVKISSNYVVQTVEGLNSAHALVKNLPSSDLDKDTYHLKQVDLKVCSDRSHPHMPGSFDDCNQEVQEKGMVSMDEERPVLQRGGQRLETESRVYKLNSPPKHGLLEKTIISHDEHGQKNNARQCQGVEMKAGSNRSGSEINLPSDDEEFKKCWENAGRGGRDQQFSKVETEPSLYDVHVIDDRSKLFKEEARKESQDQLTDTASDRFRIHGLPLDPSGVSRIDAATNQPSTRRAPTKQDIHRNGSDMSAGLPPISNTRGKSVALNLRRNSMSAVDDERLKLDTEVGWLRERLRIVQEGRQKLSFSVEHREREKIQLQLLEDIAKQLKEIRLLTQPGKAIRQASLPPASSKVTSKKRRCRSVSMGLHYST